MIEKTAAFQNFQAGFLDELEKIATAEQLTDLEKLAFLGRLGTALADWAESGGKALRARALEGVHKGRGDLGPEEVAKRLQHRVLRDPVEAGPTLDTINTQRVRTGQEALAPESGVQFSGASRLPFGHQEGLKLQRLSQLMRENPRTTGAAALAVPGTALGAGALGAAMGD